MSKGKDELQFYWLLNKLSKQASNQILTYLPTKGRFEVRENIIEGLMNTGLKCVDALELNLELFYVQESEDTIKEHNILRKKFHVTGEYEKELDSFYDQFYDDVLMWLIHGKSNIETLYDFNHKELKCFTATQLIRQGLDNFKGWFKNE